METIPSSSPEYNNTFVHNINNSNNNISNNNNKQKLVEPPSSSSFSETVSRLLFGRSYNKLPPAVEDDINTTKANKPKSANQLEQQNQLHDDSLSSSNATFITGKDSISSPVSQFQPQPSPPKPAAPVWPKQRACRAPLSRKFAHPCNCGSSNHQHLFNHHHSNSNSTSATSIPSLPPAALSNPLHLYDPVSKKCLPTSRSRDMLLKECHSHSSNNFPAKVSPPPHQQAPLSSSPCYYDDLVCDPRRFRCVCKPTLHLYYDSNLTSFGCVSIGSSSSPDGRTNCRPDRFYNVISNECQKIFDVNDLPPSYATGVSATQFSFVTIVLIWILLLILIVTAKLRKLRTSSFYRTNSERRIHHHNASYRQQNQSTSAWLHPFIAAVNGHSHLGMNRTALDRRRSHSTGMEDSGNYNDTDFFLANGNLRIDDLLSDNQYSGSQQSINNPPPKFEEIYPSVVCQSDSTTQPNSQSTPPPPSNEDLPSYDEAMKLQNTMPPDLSMSKSNE